MNSRTPRAEARCIRSQKGAASRSVWQSFRPKYPASSLRFVAIRAGAQASAFFNCCNVRSIPAFQKTVRCFHELGHHSATLAVTIGMMFCLDSGGAQLFGLRKPMTASFYIENF